MTTEIPPIMQPITLNNYAREMPSWQSDQSNHLYALVDMGSNGIRFSVSDLSPPYARLLRCRYRERAGISLFDALNNSPPGQPLLFPEETIASVSKVLARFSAIAASFGVPPEQVSVFATEAMRKAENAASMLEAVHKASGLRIQVVAPEVETLFGAMGARSGYGHVKGIFLDLGGGSVQMSYIDTSVEDYGLAAATHGKSLPFGAAKLIKILQSPETQVGIMAEQELSDGIASAFAELQRQHPSLGASMSNLEASGLDLYLCGGGFRGYGSMLMHNDEIQPYPIPMIGGYSVTGEAFRKVSTLREVNDQHDGKIFGMSKRRRTQFPAIATVIEALIKAIPSIRTATFCSGGNREGALLMKLPEAIREAEPLSLLTHIATRPAIAPDVINAVNATLRTAVPLDLANSVPTVFSLGLADQFINKIWVNQGESDEANASLQLHECLSQNPSAPGLTHLSRAILALTASARWSTQHAPVDKALYQSLKNLVNRTHPEAAFWAQYTGAVASTICTTLPAPPQSADVLTSVIQFDASLCNSGTQPDHSILTLKVRLAKDIRDVLNNEDLISTIKEAGKAKNDIGRRQKIDVSIHNLQQQ